MIRSLVVFLSVALGCPLVQAQDVSILAVGDMNLGRHVGQVLLKDSLTYPFEFVSGTFSRHDIVFGNLESQITDQHGETQSPSDRYIFCAPPQAAAALKQAGVSIVSTANNHAFDYRMRGLTETASYLQRAAVLFVGTSKDSAGTFSPEIITVRGVKIGFLACTQFVNRKRGWMGHISLFDEKRTAGEIAELKRKVDLVIVSYHGGLEYKDEPDTRTFRQMTRLVDAGADVVLGHHPHVPQGVKRYKGKWIFCSLGNFVFEQPQRLWTQRSFAVSMSIEKKDGATNIASVTLLPLSAGSQPTFSVTEGERSALAERLQRLSSVSVTRKDTVFALHDSQ